jgi:hypothetical protein
MQTYLLLPNNCCDHFINDGRKYYGARQVNVTYVGLLWYFACRIYVDDFTKRKQCCRSLLYYTSAYALTGIAAFSVLYVCKDSENEDITNFHGLEKPTY